MVQMAMAMAGRKLPRPVRCVGPIRPLPSSVPGGSAAALSHASALRAPLPFLNRPSHLLSLRIPGPVLSRKAAPTSPRRGEREERSEEKNRTEENRAEQNRGKEEESRREE